MRVLKTGKSWGIKGKFLAGDDINIKAKNDASGRNRGYLFVKYWEYKYIKDVETGEMLEERVQKNYGSTWGLNADEGIEEFEEHIEFLIEKKRYIHKVKIISMTYVNPSGWGEEPKEIKEI